MRSRPWIVACSLWLWAAACASYSGSSAPDAGSATPDAGSGDDDTSPADAGRDCGVASALFCDDFDTASLKKAWPPGPDLGGEGGLTLDTNRFVSPPQSLLATRVPGSFARVRKTVSTRLEKFVCELDIATQLDTLTNVEVFRVDLTVPNATTDGYSIWLRAAGSTSNPPDIEESFFRNGDANGGGSFKSVPVLPPGFTHLKIAVDLADSRTATVSYNGSLVAQINLSPPSNWSAATFTFGVNYDNSPGAWSVWEDNVLCYRP